MDCFVRFLEHHLGAILYGWSRDQEGQQQSFQVVKFGCVPFKDFAVHGTLGLSNHELTSPVSGKKIRQEFVFLASNEFGDRNIPAVMQQVARMALDKKQAFLRGDVIGPKGTMFDGSELEALYVTIPVYFPDTFQVFTQGETKIVMCWLVPITAKEASFIIQNGWEPFEDMLEEMDPDLVDFNRVSII